MKTDQVPVIPGLFELNSSGVHLVGARCNTCCELYFPTTQTCRNPKCSKDDLESVWLALNGTLYSYTIQYYQPPALFRIDIWEPYASGLVDFDAVVRVSAIISDLAFEDRRIGVR